MNVQNPRQIAANVLQSRARGDEYTETLLERALTGVHLAPADRGLCHELVFGCVRHQAALDWLIARKTDGRPQKLVLTVLLRLGLYQILWLDRIPGHAAVNESVELAKRNGFNTQAGFINAILRGYLRELDATKKLLAELKIKQPSVGFSHPDWLVEKWRTNFGDDATLQLLEWNNTPPKTFARVNTLKPGRAGSPLPAERGQAEDGAHGVTRPTAADLLDQWREEKVGFDAVARDWADDNLAFELQSHPPLAFLKSFTTGGFYIQDPSTLLAVRALDPQPGETILDLCAAPGGKTTFIAQLMNNTGKIIAHDTPERVKLITENCARLGVTNVEVTSTFNFQPATFNRILVDAPCSNTGVLRRRVDLRWRVTTEEIARLRATQVDLLALAATMLQPGGVLVYSTCSLEAEENSSVVQEFLTEHPGFKLASERQLTPFTDGVDGAFVARLEKIS